jgi:hypothetical protein
MTPDFLILVNLNSYEILEKIGCEKNVKKADIKVFRN